MPVVKQIVRQGFEHWRPYSELFGVILNIHAAATFEEHTGLPSAILQFFTSSILSSYIKRVLDIFLCPCVVDLKSLSCFTRLRTFFGFVMLFSRCVGPAIDYFLNGQRPAFNIDSSTVHDYSQYLISLFQT